MRGRVEAKSKYNTWYQSETMRELGRKRGNMNLAQTQVVVDKPKRKYNFKKEKEKEMKAPKIEMLTLKKLGVMFVGKPLNSNDEKNVREIVERKESPLK